MVKMAISATCPVCQVDIPLPVRENIPTEAGLSVELDVTLVAEHGRMHVRCTCAWPHGRRLHDPTCPEHS